VTAEQVGLVLLLGLGSGAVYAALGLGVVVAHRASGVLNLAFGAMAMYPSFVFAALRSEGKLVLPGVPVELDVGSVGVPVALAIAFVVAALLGLVLHLLVFRRLASAPDVAQVVATVGVLLTIQSVVVLRFGGDPRLVHALLPSHVLSLGDARLPLDRLYLVVVVVALGLLLGFAQRRTRLGVASRAVAVDPVGASLLGVSPGAVAGSSWVGAAVVAALVGILLAPITGLVPAGYSLLVVPAMAAAIAGGLTSIPLTILGGLALGLVQAAVTVTGFSVAWVPTQALKEVAPVVVLGALALARPLPIRRAVVARAMPPARTWSGGAAVVPIAVVVVGSLSVVASTGSIRGAVTVSLIGCVLCLSVAVVSGFAGQISLAQMSFAGVAAYVMSRAATTWGLPVGLAALAGVAAAAAVSATVGLAAARTQGVVVALVTLAAGIVVDELALHPASDGLLGTNDIPSARAFGIDLAPVGAGGEPGVAFGIVAAVIAALAALGVIALRRSPWGHRLLAVRAGREVAAASGIDVRRSIVVAFATSGVLAGMGGVLLGYQQGSLSPQSFGVSRSMILLAATYLGGLATAHRALVGGLFLQGALVPTLADALLGLAEHTTLFVGLAVTVMVISRTRVRAPSAPRLAWLAGGSP
jgi:branched-chain amino acid transport system permease protein